MTTGTGTVLSHLRPRWRESGPAPDADMPRWRHWRLAWTHEHVAWLTLDVADSGANTLSGEVIEELDAALDRVTGERVARALVIRSGKDAGFAAGADLREFAGADDAAAVAARLGAAHRVVDRLAALAVPTVAVIHGHCLGGGLELALACRTRIAIAGATFGFPEVRLGLHPGLGGSWRSVHAAGAMEAMTLMLTGRTVSARRARRIGLVDTVTEERLVANTVGTLLAGGVGRSAPSLRERVLQPTRRERAMQSTLRERAMHLRPVRELLARVMRRRTAARVREAHYPAPFALIELWRAHGGDDRAMQRAEIDSFARLLLSDTARNLIRVFFLHRRLKGLGGDGAVARRVHVVGAGTMGAGIAAWCALQGMQVTLADRDRAALARAVADAVRLFAKRAGGAAAAREALDRLVPDFAGDGVGTADLVIEAVAENAEVKRTLYRELEPRMKDGALLASNTSSIPLEVLRDGLARPGAFLGLHFFNPVSRMMLVEVVHHDALEGESLDRASAFVTAIDRLPVPVRSAPGFLVNRALMPYLLEAMVMVDEGIAPETVDRAAESFGMPMGPAELADRVGLDICLDVADVLRASLERPVPEVPQRFREQVSRGRLGRKTGAGIYRYDDAGKPRKRKDAPAPDDAIRDRLVLPLLDACVACLREAVVDDAELVDAAMIFATGFAPFRGGPLHHARARGVQQCTATLTRLAQRHGAHLEPDPGWSLLDDPA